MPRTFHWSEGQAKTQEPKPRDAWDGEEREPLSDHASTTVDALWARCSPNMGHDLARIEELPAAVRRELEGHEWRWHPSSNEDVGEVWAIVGEELDGFRRDWHPLPSPRGADHPRATLGEDDVRDIRERVASGETQTGLADEYGVTQSAISAIVNGRTWAWLDQPERREESPAATADPSVMEKRLDRIARLGAEVTDLKARRAELDAKIAIVERRLATAVADSRSMPTISPPDRQPRMTVKDQVKAWFELNPTAEARAGDVAEDGVGKSANAIRPTLHRLVDEGFLERPRTGVFRLRAEPESSGSEGDR